MARKKITLTARPSADLILRASIRNQKFAEAMAAARNIRRLLKSANDGDVAAVIRRLFPGWP